MSDIDDEDDPIYLDPEADMYEAMLEILEDGRLPVISFIRPGLCYYRSFSVEKWSPVMTGTAVQRQENLVRVMRFAHQEGVRDDDS